jgi:hypothetical protein
MGGVDLNLVGRYSEFFRGVPVNVGKTLFAQLMDFLPWSTFARGLLRATAAMLGCERCAAPSNTARWHSRN